MLLAAAQPLTEHVALHLVSRSGIHFRHAGRARGTVDGAVRSSITLDGLTLSGTVTVRTSDGTLRLRISGRARSGGVRSRFSGRATVIRGSGRFAHGRGTGRFDGVVNRRTWAATIDARGTLRT